MAEKKKTIPREVAATALGLGATTALATYDLHKLFQKDPFFKAYSSTMKSSAPLNFKEALKTGAQGALLGASVALPASYFLQKLRNKKLEKEKGWKGSAKRALETAVLSAPPIVAANTIVLKHFLNRPYMQTANKISQLSALKSKAPEMARGRNVIPANTWSKAFKDSAKALPVTLGGLALASFLIDRFNQKKDKK